MRVALVPLFLLVASSHAQASTFFTGSNDTCQGCMCSNAVKYEDLLLESIAPERALSDDHATGSEHASDADTHSSEDDSHSTVDDSHSSVDAHDSAHGSAADSHGSTTHASGSASGHSSAPWYTEEWEKDHFDAWVIMVLVIITLLFDMMHHKTYDIAGEAGKEHLDAHVHKDMHHHIRKIHTRSLWADLHHRCSSELAVLGFLACIVWISNQIGVYEWMEEAEYHEVSGIAMPLVAHDYLHHIENVHMQLFITMVFYFMLMAIIIAIATRLIRKCVDANFAIVTAAREHLTKPENEGKVTPVLLEFEGNNANFKRHFTLFREFFFITLERWRGQWDYFDEHMEYLKEALEKDAAMFGYKGLSVQDQTLPEVLRHWFPFDLYVVVNYRHIVDEMIEVKWTTWLAIVFFLMTQALVKRAAEQDLAVLEAWAVLCQVVILMIIIASARMYKKMTRTVNDGMKQGLPKFMFAHRLRPITTVTKLIQIAVFFTFWELVSNIASKTDWQEKKLKNTVYVLILIFGGIAEGILLGYALPIYSALVSCGPWMQRMHILRVQTILKAIERNDNMVDAQVSARKLGRNIEAFDEQMEEDEAEREAENKEKF